MAKLTELRNNYVVKKREDKTRDLLVRSILENGPATAATLARRLKITPAGIRRHLDSLVESGVKLGISSRGLGSVKEKAGLTYVEDDFQLICFDFVSEPSTTGAFMGLSESKKAPNIFNKSDKINRLLNDIIGD